MLEVTNDDLESQIREHKEVSVLFQSQSLPNITHKIALDDRDARNEECLPGGRSREERGGQTSPSTTFGSVRILTNLLQGFTALGAKLAVLGDDFKSLRPSLKGSTTDMGPIEENSDDKIEEGNHEEANENVFVLKNKSSFKRVREEGGIMLFYCTLSCGDWGSEEVCSEVSSQTPALAKAFPSVCFYNIFPKVRPLVKETLAWRHGLFGPGCWILSTPRKIIPAMECDPRRSLKEILEKEIKREETPDDD